MAGMDELISTTDTGTGMPIGLPSISALVPLTQILQALGLSSTIDPCKIVDRVMAAVAQLLEWPTGGIFVFGSANSDPFCSCYNIDWPFSSLYDSDKFVHHIWFKMSSKHIRSDPQQPPSDSSVGFSQPLDSGIQQGCMGEMGGNPSPLPILPHSCSIKESSTSLGAHGSVHMHGWLGSRLFLYVLSTMVNLMWVGLVRSRRDWVQHQLLRWKPSGTRFRLSHYPNNSLTSAG